MRVIFMGTPQFATPSLLQLHEWHQVLAVVCQPDKPNKRGKKIEYGPVKSLALQKELPILQPESVKSPEFIDEIARFKPEVIVVAAYGKILPRELLKLPRYGCINVHGSLLPKYRGAAPVQWAIINGESSTGVTIMRMDEGLDTGDMIEKRHVVIEMNDTYGTLLEKMSTVGADALISALASISDGTAKTVIQNSAEATYAPIIKKETGHINWSSSGKDAANLVRGLNPAPGAYCLLNGQKLKVWGAQIWGKSEPEAAYGQIIKLDSHRGIVVNAFSESVLLTEVQKSGGKRMSAADFMRGHEIEKGALLK